MNFTKKKATHSTRDVSSDNAAISFDLYSNLTYMAAVSVGEPSRDLIMAKVLEQEFTTGVFFRQVYLMTKRMGFEYSRAFRLVAKKAKAHNIKNLLLRFAGAINSGVSEVDFLLEEAKVEAEVYNTTYLRSIETLSKWADAYAALLVSVTLVVVVAMISTMLSQLGNSFLLMLTFAMVFVTAFGVYIIFRTAPAEDIVYQNRRGPKHRRTSKRLLIIGAPAGVVAGMFLSLSYGMPVLLIMIGLGLLPSGVFAWIDNGRIGKVDKGIYPVEMSAEDSDTAQAFADLRNHIEALPARFELIIFDSLTGMVAHAEDRGIIDFFAGCKKLCDQGRTIVTIVHSYAFNDQMLIRVRSLCDAHLIMKIDQMGERLVKSMEVAKVRNADQPTGNIISFDVEPGIGMKIIPISKAKA